MNIKSQTPLHIASHHTPLARLTAQAQALIKLDQHFRSHLPTLVAACCQAVRIEDGELLVFADNGLMAARLRMLAPAILPKLAAQGYVADRVRVRVQLRLAPVSREKSFNISEQALNQIEHSTLTHIKNPTVSAAMAKLIAHHRRK